jgi:hypothetical protein
MIPRYILAILFILSLSMFPGTRFTRIHAQTTEPAPFRLPFQDPPGPHTWLLGQAYGNTAGAYRQRATTYAAGQGLHFGVDLSARCGYEIVAIGDGVVTKVDALEHGHLLERPDLVVGQAVQAGQIVAKVGDPDETCTSRPHLHLEIRNAGQYNRAFNPLTLIAADWDNLTLVGSFGRSFARDLSNPRLWQNIYDQPETTFGGLRLNDYSSPWPQDWNR